MRNRACRWARELRQADPESRSEADEVSKAQVRSATLDALDLSRLPPDELRELGLCQPDVLTELLGSLAEYARRVCRICPVHRAE